jgi:hypothetical protein
MRTKDPTKKQRNIRVSKEDNRIFKMMLLDLYDISVFRTPDQLADELFQIGLHVKNNEIQKLKS